MQQSWAYAHNVNLLAAGISTPEDGYSGSGIYSGHSGALSAVISDTPLTKLLVAFVPKVPGTILPKTISSKDKSSKHHGVASNPAMIFSKENLPDLDFLMLNFTQSTRREGKICKNDFCCHYAIEVFAHKLPANAVSVCALNSEHIQYATSILYEKTYLKMKIYRFSRFIHTPLPFTTA